MSNQKLAQGFPFIIYYVKEMEHYLEHMSLSGYILEKINSRTNAFVFFKSDPKKLTYRILINNHSLGENELMDIRNRSWEPLDSLKLWNLFSTRWFHFLTAEIAESDDWIKAYNKESISNLNLNEETLKFIFVWGAMLAILAFYIVVSRVDLFFFGVYLVFAASSAYDLDVCKRARIKLKDSMTSDSTILDWRDLERAEKMRNANKIPYMLFVAILIAVFTVWLKKNIGGY
jgi:hypothetical protein